MHKSPRTMNDKPVKTIRGAAGLVVVLGLLALSLANCGPLRPNREATRTAEAVIVGERLEQTIESDRSTQMVASATARMAVAYTEVSRRETAVAATQEAATQIAIASATALAEEQARARATATQQAAGIAALVQSYVEKGWLPNAEGLYYKLDDYSGDEPNLGNVLVRGTGYSPQQFVLRSHVRYENAGKARDASLSSCGFILWRVDGENYYQVYLGMDGFVYANTVTRNRFVPQGKSFYGFPALPNGEYDVTLIVNKLRTFVLYNGELVKTYLNVEGAQQEGKLYFAVTSGVNKDFGTRCTFTDAELWELTPEEED